MAATITKVKILLDEHQQPFIPFVTTDSVFKDGTEETMTEYIDDYLEQKDAQVDAFIEDADEHIDDTIEQAQLDVNAIIADLEYKRDHGYFTGPQGPQGIQGEKGDTGDTGVYYGPDEPTNPDISIWIDTADPVALAIAEESDF